MNINKIFLLCFILSLNCLISAEQLRIMTFNFQEAVSSPLDFTKDQQKKNKTNPIRRNLAVSLLNDYAPDILGFQEPHLGDLDFFQSKLKNYAWTGEPIIPLAKQHPLRIVGTLGSGGSDYNAIFYNKNKLNLLSQGTFWLNETMKPGEPSKWGEPGRKHFHIRACTWANFEFKNTKKNFWVFNTHLSLDSSVSKEELKLIAKTIEQKVGKEPVFFIGDFNMWNPYVVLGKESGYNAPVFTYTEKKRSIDHIMTKNTPQNFTIKRHVINYRPKYQKNDIVPSDHVPIYADASF